MFTAPVLAISFIFSAIALFNSTDDYQDSAIQDYVKPAIYQVYSTYRGTGFAVKNDKGKTYVVTNAHICGRTSKPGEKIRLLDQNDKRYKAKIVFVSKIRDICVLKAPRKTFALRLAKKAYMDARTYAVGYPTEPFLTTTHGVIKGKIAFRMRVSPEDMPQDQCFGGNYFLKVHPLYGPQCNFIVEGQHTTIMGDKGASGSPLVDHEGKVVGVVSHVHAKISWIVGVDLESLREILNRL